MTDQTLLENTQTVSRRYSRLKVGGIGLLVLILLVTAGFAVLNFGDVQTDGLHTDTESGDPAESDKAEVATGHSMIVTLPKGKLTAAGIQVESVVRGSLIHSHNVPGRVAYDDNRHIEVTSPTNGVLTQVLVKPGTHVQAGQTLAWLNSPEIGSTRADVLEYQAKVELTSRLTDHARTLEKNVLALTSAVRQQPDFETLKKRFVGRILGDYREKLFAAYSQTQLAESIVKSSIGLAKSGTLSGKVMQERRAAAQSARAALEAASEQAELDVWKERAQAEATAHDAQRRLEIFRQHLASLLLNKAALRPNSDMPNVLELGLNDDENQRLSQVAVRAPFAGTIESRTFSASERVQAADSMFVLADTTTLWITAEIRENDWSAVSIQAGQSLTVSVPALGGATIRATVEFIGREVSSDTNAIPIVARVDNSDGHLRPGLFVRVAVPVGVKSNVLTVPNRAILRQDRQSFVFIAEEEDRFRRVHVVTGDEGEGRVEIVSGLNVGDPVVTYGAFVLMSELRLEGEGK